MKTITLDLFNELLQQLTLRPRLKSELRFVSSIKHIREDEWSEFELIAIKDRTGNKGLLLIEGGDSLYALPYEISRNMTDVATGRSRPVICDFCRTWQNGGNVASITFRKDPRSLHSVSYLCCANLYCSSHVRTKTNASLRSRAQLREDLTNEGRVDRLRSNLQKFAERMELQSIEA